jgi:hypothetical protein
MSHADIGIVGAATDGFILFENGLGRNRLVLRFPDLNLLRFIHGGLGIELLSSTSAFLNRIAVALVRIRRLTLRNAHRSESISGEGQNGCSGPRTTDYGLSARSRWMS